MPSKTPHGDACGQAGEVALEPQVDAGGRELGAGFGGEDGVGEVGGAGPAAEGDEDLEAGVAGLELLELAEVALERLVVGVGDAVDALVGGHGALPVGPGVGGVAGALRADEPEGVVDVGQLPGGAARLHILDVVVAPLVPPFAQHVTDGMSAQGLATTIQRDFTSDVLRCRHAAVVRVASTDRQARRQRQMTTYRRGLSLQGQGEPPAAARSAPGGQRAGRAALRPVPARAPGARSVSPLELPSEMASIAPLGIRRLLASSLLVR